MRKGLLGTAALLAASRLSAAGPPQVPPAAPPAPFAIPAETATALPPATEQPMPGVAQPPAGNQPETPAQPSAGGTTQPQAQTQAQATGAPGTQAANAFRDCHCGPPEWLWLGGGPVLAWIKNGPLPPLAIASTGETLGGSNVGYGKFIGVEADGGVWFNDRHTWGASVGGFLLEQRSTFGSLTSDAAGSPAIARPIVDALTATPLAVQIAAPGSLAGSVAFATSSRLWGAEASIVHNVFYTKDYTVDVGFGFRYLDLEEDLIVSQASQALGGGAIFLNGLNGTSVPGVFLEDRFSTRNQIYAGQFSTRAEYRFGPAFVNLLSKVALGPNHETFTIDGSTSGGGITQTGSLLAVGTGGFGNIGRNTTNRFVVVPEVGADLGVQLSRHVRMSAGYHFLYVNDVARPGSLIDPVINQQFVPVSPAFGTASGPNTPRLTGQRDEFYAHGILFRLEVVY